MRTVLRSSRVRKWLAFVLFVTMLAGWVASFQYSVRYQGPKGNYVVVFDGGGLLVAWYSTAYWDTRYAGWQVGLAVERQEGRTWLLPQLTHPRAGASWLFIPFLPLLLMLMGVMGWLFWKDHPPPVTHCRFCGYDMRGNISGVCPECGTPRAAEAIGVDVAKETPSRKAEGDDTR